MIGGIARLFPGPALLGKVALYAAVFLIGGAVGNYHATQKALDRELQASADRQRKNHQELIAWYAGKMKELRLAREQQEGADAAAYAVLEQGRAEAARSAEQARASLRIALSEKQKLEETNDGLKAVNQILGDTARAISAADAPSPAPGCFLPSGVRLALDAASGAADTSSSGDSEAPPTGLPDGTDPASTPLACSDLARGYVNLAEHDRMLQAWVATWQAWANQALK